MVGTVRDDRKSAVRKYGKTQDRQYIMQQKMIQKERMNKMTEYLIQGMNLIQIAKVMDITYKVAYRLKGKLDARMRKISQDNVESLRAVKDLQYSWCLKELLEQWEASKVNSKGETKRADVVFIDRILAVFEAQRKMHGIDVNNKDVSGGDAPTFDWRSLTSMTINVNGTPQEAIKNADKILQQEVQRQIAKPVNAPTTSKLLSEVEQRINELERRKALHEEKQQLERDVDERNSQQITKHKRLVIKARSVPFSQESDSVASALGSE